MKLEYLPYTTHHYVRDGEINERISAILARFGGYSPNAVAVIDWEGYITVPGFRVVGYHIGSCEQNQCNYFNFYLL